MPTSHFFETTEEFAAALDKQDPLASFRERFFYPEGTIYLDGNSLGLMSHDAQECLQRVQNEWKDKAIDGWLSEPQPWFSYAEKLGSQAAGLVGAQTGEVVATATVTVNIHALVSSFYRPQGQRKKILADELNFPSDIYALKGQLALKGFDPEENLVLVSSRDGKTLEEADIAAAMNDEIALALFSSVLYRSGQLLDMEYLAGKAHEHGIMIGFDCCHSAGAVPHRLSAWEVDFATWCSYKYLNGGPGAPAFLYVNRRHFDRGPVLAGWFGSAKDKQFDMSLTFSPARDAGAWQISSPAIISNAAVEGALRISREAGIERIREKSLHMTEYLFFLVDQLLSRAPYHIHTGTPRQPQRRGGHVALERQEDAWAICAALKARGVIPDYRPPNIIRFAPVALYNTYHEIWQAVQIVADIIEKEDYRAFAGLKQQIT